MYFTRAQSVKTLSVLRSGSQGGSDTSITNISPNRQVELVVVYKGYFPRDDQPIINMSYLTCLRSLLQWGRTREILAG